MTQNEFLWKAVCIAVNYWQVEFANMHASEAIEKFKSKYSDLQIISTDDHSIKGIVFLETRECDSSLQATS